VETGEAAPAAQAVRGSPYYNSTKPLEAKMLQVAGPVRPKGGE